MPTSRRRSLSLSILITAMLLGTVVRLHNIADRSMAHIEMFVPGIPLPPDLSVPKPRMDLWTTVTSTLNSDTHPPGFYVMISKWGKSWPFGSGKGRVAHDRGFSLGTNEKGPQAEATGGILSPPGKQNGNPSLTWSWNQAVDEQHA